MSDPIGALSNILKGKKTANTAANSDFATPTYTLPNGGGSYGVGGLNQPLVQTPSVPTPQFTPQSAVETPMGPFMNTPQGQVATPSKPNPGIIPPNVISGTADTGMSPDEQAKIQSIVDKYKNEQPTSDGLYNQWLKERETGTGLYALPQGVTLSPDQVFGLRSMADDHYASILSAVSNKEKNDAALNKTKTNTSLSDMSSSPWLEGLRINGLVQGGTADERAQNLSYLSGLPEDRQKALVMSGLYNSMSTGERQKFDSYDEVTAGTKQIASMLPEDIATNPYKYVTDKYSVFLGGKGTKKYQDFEAVLGRITAPIINNIYGAAVTGSELSRAQTFIPDLAIDSTQRVGEKLKNLAAFAEFAQDAALAKKAGMPKPSLDDYIKKYTGIVDGTNKSNTGGFAEEW